MSQPCYISSALLSILGTCAAGLRPGDPPTAKETRYTELTMKCLWKLAKTVQENLRTGVLNADELLYEINRFFITTPPTEWKRRAAEKVPLGEMPLRTVKTLLLELVTGLGDAIFQHLTLIENPQSSSVYPYLHHMLQACRKRERDRGHQQASPRSSLGSPQQVYQEDRFAQRTSLSRPNSISSLKSTGMARSGSMASHPSSAEHENDPPATIPVATPQYHGNNVYQSPPPPRHTQVQAQHDDAMQVDEPEHVGTRPITDHEMNNLLTQIFVKIGTRDQTKQVGKNRSVADTKSRLNAMYMNLHRVSLSFTSSRRSIRSQKPR